MATRSGDQGHWDHVYERTASEGLSWYQAEPTLSLRLIQAAGLGRDARILDVGGGTSSLAGRLLDAGCRRVGVLEISPRAVAEARRRLGDRAARVEWFTDDVTRFATPHPWDIWHDRALFHFLTAAGERATYREVLLRSLAPGGQAILATFAPTGPDRCSGLPVTRYDASSLETELGPELQLIESVPETHRTPGGVVQDFIYCRFSRPTVRPDPGVTIGPMDLDTKGFPTSSDPDPPQAIRDAERQVRNLGVTLSGIGFLGTVLYWVSAFLVGFPLLPLSWWGLFLLALSIAFFFPPTRRTRIAREILRRWDEHEARSVLEEVGAPDEPRLQIAARIAERIERHPSTDESLAGVTAQLVAQLRSATRDLRLAEVLRQAKSLGVRQGRVDGESMADTMDYLEARVGQLLSSLEELHRAVLLRDAEGIRRTKEEAKRVLGVLAAERQVEALLSSPTDGLST